METRTYNVYKLNELSEKGQEKAIERYADINVDYDWWDCLYYDAKTIGLKIDGFDIYRGDIEGNLLESVGEVCKRIIDNHGKTCDTYKLAQKYFKGEYRTGEESDKEEFLHDLLQEYLSLLRKDYDYFTSRESIIETFEANDYNFTEDGKID